MDKLFGKCHIMAEQYSDKHGAKQGKPNQNKRKITYNWSNSNIERQPYQSLCPQQAKLDA